MSTVESEGKGGNILILLVEIRDVYEYAGKLFLAFSGCEVYWISGEARDLLLVVEWKYTEGVQYLLMHVPGRLKFIDDLLSEDHEQSKSSMGTYRRGWSSMKTFSPVGKFVWWSWWSRWSWWKKLTWSLGEEITLYLRCPTQEVT